MVRRRSGSRTFTVRDGVAPTRERHRQNGGVTSDIVARDSRDMTLVRRYRAVWECPLDAYRDRGIITGAEYVAGRRFRRVYRGAITNRVTCYERPYAYPTNMGMTMSEKILKEAYRALPLDSVDVVIDVCGHDMHIWKRDAIEKLRKGLGHLAVRWNMVAIEICDCGQ